MATAIHIVPDDSFDDWVVRDEDGSELGHYPTREEAEIVGETRARKRGDELVIHLPDGRTNRKSFAKGWLARWFST
jgi:Uncharacterized protein conserved in bacteria (DUF2188)